VPLGDAAVDEGREDFRETLAVDDVVVCRRLRSGDERDRELTVSLFSKWR
jgi:hypothetical protein